jgi:hypothetical protein
LTETLPEGYHTVVPPKPKTHSLTSRRSFLGYPDRERGPFMVAAHWIEQDGRTIPVGVEVWKGVHPLPAQGEVGELGSGTLQGLEATDLRQIPLATILSELWDMQKAASEAAHALVEETRPGWGDWLEPQNYKGRYRRVSPDDLETFRQVAAVYQEEMRSPGRKRPTDSVAQHFGVSHSAAAKWVKRARELGLMPGTSPGKPSDLAPVKRTTGRKKK